MTRRLWLLAAVVTAATATTTVFVGGEDNPDTGAVTVVTGSLQAPMVTEIIQTTLDPIACTLGANCWERGATPSLTRCNLASSAPLRDLVYFGNLWFFLQKSAGDPPIYLAGGYANARVERDADGTFFVGIVEKVDGAGSVTDVVIAFTGANTADDFASAPAFIAGVETPQLSRAVDVYERTLHNPRYAKARFHITGFSLGSGLTQYLLGYTLATYGASFSDARVTYTGFGVPGWAQGAANRYRLPITAFDGRFTGYTPQNDAVQLLGNSRMATDYFLAPYTPVGLFPAVPANNVIAHSPYPYISAIGLPSWLGSQETAIVAKVQQGQALPMDPDYGTPGNVAVRLVGDTAAKRLDGTAAADRLRGGRGMDTVCGGAGGDRFEFASADDSGTRFETATRLLDFKSDEGDRIDLSVLVRSVGPADFRFVGDGQFSGPRQVRAYQERGDMIVAVHIGGNIPNMLIRLVGKPVITSSDLVLSPSSLLQD